MRLMFFYIYSLPTFLLPTVFLFMHISSLKLVISPFNIHLLPLDLLEANLLHIEEMFKNKTSLLHIEMFNQ